MQDLLTSLFWNNPEIEKAVSHYCDSLPEYRAAKRRYDDAASKVAAAVDFSLYDEFQTSLLRYTDYEVYAYYCFGLGLREMLMRGLE